MNFGSRRFMAAAGIGAVLAAGGAGFAAACNGIDPEFSHVVLDTPPLQEKIDPEFSHVEATAAKESAALELLKKGEEEAGHAIASASVHNGDTFHLSLADTFNHETDQAVIDAVIEEAKKAGFEKFTMVAAPVYFDEKPELEIGVAGDSTQAEELPELKIGVAGDPAQMEKLPELDPATLAGEAVKA